MSQTLTFTGAYADVASPAKTAGQPAFGATVIARLKALFGGSRTADVETFIQANGGVLTDDLEREISRRFGRAAGI